MIRLLLLATLLLTAACGRSGSNLTGAIKTDGSSTVAPLTSAVVGAFVQKNPDVQISVSATGTTGGFQSFCQGTTEIANASRPINAAEESACVQSGVQFIELPVAQDAITVIVHPSNDWAQNMSIAELKKLWEPAAEGRVMRWADVRADWPAEPIKLVGPGPLSGTFDFFTETIVGVVDSSRRDYSGSEDDDAIVKAVANDRLAGVRIFGPGASAAQDFEPEDIAVAPDSRTAYVTLQENNAVAVIDIARLEFTRILPRGFKNHMLTGLGLDPTDNKGPEPEGRTYVFIGLERIGGVMTYDITDPRNPTFVDYTNNWNFSGNIQQFAAGDLSPEGLAFVPARSSPTGRPMLIVGNEVSGSTTFYDVNVR